MLYNYITTSTNIVKRIYHIKRYQKYLMYNIFKISTNRKCISFGNIRKPQIGIKVELSQGCHHIFRNFGQNLPSKWAKVVYWRNVVDSLQHIK